MSDINQPEKNKSITIFTANGDRNGLSFYVGQGIPGVHYKTVKDIDAYLQDSGARITYSDGSFELFSGVPFIFRNVITKECEHLWLEIDEQHDLKNQFNEQCQKCLLLRNSKTI